MNLSIDSSGVVRCLYAETIDLQTLGTMTIERASHVEPDADGQWWAELSPVDGPTLGPFSRRTDALAAEQGWLEKHWVFLHSSAAPHANRQCDHVPLPEADRRRRAADSRRSSRYAPVQPRRSQSHQERR